MKKYTKVDLLRFALLKQENPTLRNIALLELYDKEYPEISEKDQLINLAKALGINGLHKALTGKNIDKNDDLYKSWNELT